MPNRMNHLCGATAVDIVIMRADEYGLVGIPQFEHDFLSVHDNTRSVVKNRSRWTK